MNSEPGSMSVGAMRAKRVPSAPHSDTRSFPARALRAAGGAILALAIGVLLTVVLDRCLRLVVHFQSPAGIAESTGLLFPPKTSVTYVMPEAQFTAHINSLGFRDREFSAAKSKDTVRAIAIGDSYTFGWGVDDDGGWPKIVERELRAQGHAVEIANLGSPGANPTAYASTAERSIPLLHPDLVILGVLSGQDYSQAWWSTQTVRERFVTHAPKEWPGLIWLRVHRIAAPLLEKMYPNSAALIGRIESARAQASADAASPPRDSTRTLGDTRKPQSAEALSIESQFGSKQRDRFHHLDPAVVRMFRVGEINPSLIYFAADRPELFALVDDYQSDRGQKVVQSMARDFARIREAAERNNARVIILSTPYVAYASAHDCQTMRRFGFICDARMYQSDAADRSTEQAGALAKIPVYKVTQDFRAAAAQRQLFFQYDDHPNRDGYQVLGDLFTPIVAKALPAPKP